MKFLSIAMAFFTIAVKAQSIQIPQDENSIALGKKLFADNCSQCHEFGRQNIGPSLASITDKMPTSWLMAFIQNSQLVLQGDDPYAIFVYREYNNMVMPEFPELDNTDILNILAYIKNASIDETYVNANDSIDSQLKNILGKYKTTTSDSNKSGEIAQNKDYFTDAPANNYRATLEEIQQGEKIFKAQCADCHAFDKRTFGPAIAAATERLPHQWLLDFIKNPERMIKSGDDYATHLAGNYNIVMPSFENLLSDDEIIQVLSYIKYATGAENNSSGSNANRVMTGTENPAMAALPEANNAEPLPDFAQSLVVKIVVGFFGALLLAGIIFILIKFYRGLVKRG